MCYSAFSKCLGTVRILRVRQSHCRFAAEGLKVVDLFYLPAFGLSIKAGSLFHCQYQQKTAYPLGYAQPSWQRCRPHLQSAHLCAAIGYAKPSPFDPSGTHLARQCFWNLCIQGHVEKGLDRTTTQAQHVQKYSYADQSVCSLPAVCHAFITHDPDGLTPGAFHAALGNMTDLQITDGAANDDRQ